MSALWLAVGSAFWLGLLTSISPCPLATNVAAVSYVGRQVGRPRAVLGAGLLYTAGRTLAYVGLGGVAAWSLMSVVKVSGFLQGTFHRLLGPLLIAIALLLLGLFELELPGVGFGERLRRWVDRSGVWGAGLLGVGTAVPVAGFAVLLAAGVAWVGPALDRVQVVERWARLVTAVVLLGVGVYETLRSTFYLI